MIHAEVIGESQEMVDDLVSIFNAIADDVYKVFDTAINEGKTEHQIIHDINEVLR